MSIIADALKKAEKKSIDIRPPAGLHPKRPLFKLFIILFAVLSLGSAYFYILTKDTDTARTPSHPPDVIKTAEVKQDIVEKKPQRIFEKPAETMEINAATSAALSGIMYVKNKPLAVINNIMMGEGEEVGNIRVLRIRPASVDIERNGKILTLRLNR